ACGGASCEFRGKNPVIAPPPVTGGGRRVRWSRCRVAASQYRPHGADSHSGDQVLTRHVSPDSVPGSSREEGLRWTCIDRPMFRRRRERRRFREASAREVARIERTVEAAAAAVEDEVARTTAALRALPGAAARCPRCQSRMTLRRVKERRKWWT